MWLLLLVHVLSGTTGLVSGFIAVAAAKGGQLHRRAGRVFVIAMIFMGVFGAVVATYELKLTAIGGILSAYFVFTGLTTVRPLASTTRAQQVGLMILALAIAVTELAFGIVALGQSRAMVSGVPAGMVLFIGTIALLAAIGDWRIIRAGGIQGTRRLARHLWRMCFALFFASGSFFLGQMQVFPKQLRIMPVLMTLGISPLVILLYWMWRVRLRQSLRGMIISRPRAAARA
jgi:uncharacterized membrane protein